MPTVQVLFAAPGLEIGVFRCLPGDRAWREENTIGEGYHVVLPGPPVLIQQSRSRPVVTNVNHTIYYDTEEVYRRGLLSDRGDQCVFIRTSEAVIREVVLEADPGLAGSSTFRFPFVNGPLTARTHLRHRLLVQHLAAGPDVDRLFAAESVLGLLATVVGESVRAHGRRPRPEPRRRRAATENVHRDLVEDAKAVLSRRFHERLGLDDVATAVGTSPFHLARVFRRHTGSSLHAYRTQLRLRSALDALADPRRQVGGLALELGFASSSHFVDSFRAAFATTPTGYRRAVGRRDAQASPRLML